MDFTLSEEQTAIRDGTYRFASELVTRDTTQANDEFPETLWRRCGEVGVLGLLVPREYGGSGCECLTAAIALEAFGKGCGDHGLVHAVCTQIVCSMILSSFGTPAQCREYLPPLCSGERIFSQAMTEPDAGSDTAA